MQLNEYRRSNSAFLFEPNSPGVRLAEAKSMSLVRVLSSVKFPFRSRISSIVPTMELVRLQSCLETELRFKPQMVKKRKQSYEMEGTVTQISVELLDSFYEQHNKEVCELVEVYPCLQLNVFQQLCRDS